MQLLLLKLWLLHELLLLQQSLPQLLLMLHDLLLSLLRRQVHRRHQLLLRERGLERPTRARWHRMHRQASWRHTGPDQTGRADRSHLTVAHGAMGP